MKFSFSYLNNLKLELEGSFIICYKILFKLFKPFVLIPSNKFSKGVYFDYYIIKSYSSYSNYLIPNKFYKKFKYY